MSSTDRNCRLLYTSAVLAAVAFAGCQKKAPGPPPRYTVLRFENLTGDATLDWSGRAISEDLSRRLEGALDGVVVGTSTLSRLNAGLGTRSAGAPGVSSERSAAPSSSANHAITGYLTRSGNALRLTAAVEDLSTHKMMRYEVAGGKTLLECVQTLARQMSARPGAGITVNESALRAFAEGLEAPFAQQAGLFERAIAADPGLGPAWISLVRVTAGQNPAAARAFAEKAIGQKVAAVDLASLLVEKAELEGDGKARIKALQHYTELDPGDVLLLRSLAELESVSGEFARAAASYGRLAALLPGEIGALNQAGYNFAWAGNYSEAVKAMSAYANLAPNDANAIDSMGDVNYWFGRYAEAAVNYSAAHAKNPKLLNGGDLYKAAWAKWRAGDLKAGDALLDEYLKFRESSKDSSLAVLQADWLYQTGRKEEAEQLLRKEADSATDQAGKPAMFGELAVWNLVAGRKDLALADLRRIGAGATPVTITAQFAAQPAASAEEWEVRAQRRFAQPPLNRMRDSALGWALLLDGKKDAAKRVWEKVVADAPAIDFFSREVLARLKGQTVKNLAAPDARNINQFAAVIAGH